MKEDGDIVLLGKVIGEVVTVGGKAASLILRCEGPGGDYKIYNEILYVRDARNRRAVKIQGHGGKIGLDWDIIRSGSGRPRDGS